MDALGGENATIAGLRIPQRHVMKLADFILSDLVEAKILLHSRSKYSGIRINKEAAMVLAMNVALYEELGKSITADDFASSTNESNYFLGEVVCFGK